MRADQNPEDAVVGTGGHEPTRTRRKPPSRRAENMRVLGEAIITAVVGVVAGRITSAVTGGLIAPAVTGAFVGGLLALVFVRAKKRRTAGEST